MMGDLGGLLAISEISLPSSQLHSATCWANLLLPLVGGNFNKTEGGAGVGGGGGRGGSGQLRLERTSGSKDAAFLCYQIPGDRF